MSAASCVVANFVTTQRNLRTATEMSGRAIRLRNNNVATWLEALEENLPGSSPSWAHSSEEKYGDVTWASFLADSFKNHCTAFAA